MAVGTPTSARAMRGGTSSSLKRAGAPRPISPGRGNGFPNTTPPKRTSFPANTNRPPAARPGRSSGASSGLGTAALKWGIALGAAAAVYNAWLPFDQDNPLRDEKKRWGLPTIRGNWTWNGSGQAL